MQKRRAYIPELDDLRAMAIIGVVTIHGILPMLHHSRGSTDYHVGLLLNQLTRYCVPLFLLVAALLVTYTHDLKEPRAFGPFIRRRAVRVLVPYGVWTLIGLLQRGVPGPEALFRTVFLGQGYYGQLYFVPLIMQFYLLSPLLYRAIGHRYRRCTVVGLLVVQAVMLVLYELMYLRILPVPSSVLNALNSYVQPLFPVWMGYWALGMVLGLGYLHFGEWVASVKVKPLLFAFAAAGAWVLADAYVSIGITGTPFSQATNFFRLSVMAFSLASFVLLFRWARSEWYQRRRKGRFGRIMGHLGQHSFGIFLIHIFIQRELQTGSLTAGLFTSWYGNVVGILLCLALSLGASVLLSRIPLGWLLVGTSTRRQYQSGSTPRQFPTGS